MPYCSPFLRNRSCFTGKEEKKSSNVATIFGNERAYIAIVLGTTSTPLRISNRYKDTVDQSESHRGNPSRRYSRRSLVVQQRQEIFVRTASTFLPFPFEEPMIFVNHSNHIPLPKEFIVVDFNELIGRNNREKKELVDAQRRIAK